MPTKKALPLFLLCAFASTAYVATSACGSNDFSSTDDGDASVVNGACDTTLTPSQTSCVINESDGVFVTTTATAAGADGTRAHPFATLQAGITSAKSQQKRVYACIGTYAEQITIADGVSIFGNLDCAHNWSAITQHAILKAPSSPAMRADQIQSATRIDSLDIDAADGNATSPSSIAILETGSPGLTVANATIHAGKGFDGESGVAGVQLVQTSNVNGGQNPADPACILTLSANCPLNGIGGATSTCSFPDGGIADNGGWNGGAGGSGGSGGGCLSGGTCPVGEPPVPVPCCLNADHAPTPGSPPPQGAPSQAGANGNSGTNAAPGLLSSSGYTPANGTDGSNGGPGNGGDGTAGSPTPFTRGRAASGVGGGAGGCPGIAGTAGKGGGASIAVLASDSASTFDTCTLQSSKGGDAGRGTFGSDATPGGTGGDASGVGGNGGSSGWSGNGSAGPSYGVAAHGAAPTQKNTTTQLGAGGAGVAAQTSGAKTIPATPAGASLAFVTIQ